MDCQAGAFRHALSICLQKKKKNQLHHLFQKKGGKRKLIKTRFSKVMHSSLKLEAFSYALSPLSRTNKKHSLLFKKNKKTKQKERKKIFFF